MKYSNVFWGVILITIGSLIALRNFDIFYFSWRGIFNLWPLIFVFWGIALLPIKALGKIGLTAATVLVGLIILANHPRPYNNWNFNWNDHGNYNFKKDTTDSYPWTNQQFEEDFNNEYETVEMHIDAAAGDFKLNGITSKLFEFQTEGNTGPYSVETTDNENRTATINFTHKQFTARSHFKNDVRMQLNDNPVWIFDIDLGAASLDLDLSPFKTEKITIDGGASAIKLKLGNAFNKTKVEIDAGATGIEIRVPRESAVEVHTETFLSGKDLEDFVRIDKGLYQTPNFSDTAAYIYIDIEAAISGVKVIRY